MNRLLVAATLMILAAATAQAQTVRMPILKFPTDWPTAVGTAPSQQPAQADN